MSSWLEPLCCTRTGAAHRRRGTPCQDASGWLSFRDREGTPVQVMVVADGHGGGRYLHSEIGSWLACRVALGAIRQRLRAEATATGPSALQMPAQRWQRLLGQDLPRVIQQRWLRAVRKHWQSLAPADSGESFSPLLYGTTLGLVVMTPRWWGHTGLGDWDLLRVWADGAQLLSEESDAAASGEATFSLCLADAAAHFAARTRIEIMEPEGAEFALMLSTDGIRKSCSTDSDFLALGRYLSEAPSAASTESTIDLDASLDRISSQGSGDDVSVALALWQPGRSVSPGPWTAGGLNGASSRSRLQPSRPQNRELRPDLPAPEREACSAPQVDPEPTQAAGEPADRVQIPAEPAPVRRPPGRLSLLVAALLLGGLAAAAMVLWAPWTARTPEPAPSQLPGPAQLLESLRRKMGELCAPQVPIRELLVKRRPTFQGLRQGRLDRGLLLSASDLDSLSALIALSYDPGSGGLSRAPAWAGLQPCPQLQEALSQLWLETKASETKAPEPVVPEPVVPEGKAGVPATAPATGPLPHPGPMAAPMPVPTAMPTPRPLPAHPGKAIAAPSRPSG